jgi:hypothetical protein
VFSGVICFLLPLIYIQRIVGSISGRFKFKVQLDLTATLSELFFIVFWVVIDVSQMLI